MPQVRALSGPIRVELLAARESGGDGMMEDHKCVMKDCGRPAKGNLTVCEAHAGKDDREGAEA